MVSLSLLVSLAIVPFVVGQATDTNNTQFQIEAIQAHFSGAGIVPSLLTTFDPEALLTISYDGVSALTPGQALTKTQVAPTPVLAVTPANSTVSLTGSFTLVMADAGPVGTDETQGQTRHWLVNGVTLTGSAPLNVSTTDGVAITSYAGPAPAQGSGAHRYVILLYSQPSSFAAPQGLDTANTPVSVFNLSDYVKTSGLGPLVAANYITVEEGTATFTPSSTAPVATSTLPVPATSTGGSSAASTGSKTGSAAPTSTGNAQQSGAIPKISKTFSVEVLFMAGLATIGFLFN
ncbi:PEBP-like protein [Abortiporus biennis]